MFGLNTFRNLLPAGGGGGGGGGGLMNRVTIFVFMFMLHGGLHHVSFLSRCLALLVAFGFLRSPMYVVCSV